MRRIADEYLVFQPPKPGLVGQVFRRDVGGEDDELVEGDLELLAGVQRQKVVSALERHDPAVDERLRQHLLPPEIVDDEDAAGRLEM